MTLYNFLLYFGSIFIAFGLGIDIEKEISMSSTAFLIVGFLMIFTVSIYDIFFRKGAEYD